MSAKMLSEKAKGLMGLLKVFDQNKRYTNILINKSFDLIK